MKVLNKIIEKLKYDFGIFRIRHLGEKNPDKTFFVIRDSSPNAGPLSEWFRLCAAINFASKHNFIPILDFKNAFNSVFTDDIFFKKENAWEFYFVPPFKYSLEEVYVSKRVIFAPSIWSKSLSSYKISTKEQDSLSLFMNKESLEFFNSWYRKMPFSSEIYRKAELYKSDFFPKDEKILGVSFRREFEADHAWNLPVTPPGTHIPKATLESLIMEIEEKLKIVGYNFFFLSCDDRESCDLIKEIFKEKCVITDRKLTHCFELGKPLNVVDDKRVYQEFNGLKYPRKERISSYLAEVLLLSQCNSFLMRGGSNDRFALMINNGKYERVF